MKRAIQRQGSAEEAGSPKSFWSLQIDKNSSEFAKALGRPVPCEQGAADNGLPHLPPTSVFLVCVFGLWVCGFVVLWFVSLGV